MRILRIPTGEFNVLPFYEESVSRSLCKQFFELFLCKYWWGFLNLAPIRCYLYIPLDGLWYCILLCASSSHKTTLAVLSVIISQLRTIISLYIVPRPRPSWPTIPSICVNMSLTRSIVTRPIYRLEIDKFHTFKKSIKGLHLRIIECSARQSLTMKLI